MKLYVVFCIAVCLFALYGMYEAIRKMADIYVQKKSGAACDIIIKKCDKKYVEYIVRFAESRFLYGDYSIMFENIRISKDAQADEKLTEKLNYEFGNVKSGEKNA